MRETYFKVDQAIKDMNISQSGSTAITILLKRLPNGERWLYSANVGDAGAILKYKRLNNNKIDEIHILKERR